MIYSIIQILKLFDILFFIKSFIKSSIYIFASIFSINLRLTIISNFILYESNLKNIRSFFKYNDVNSYF